MFRRTPRDPAFQVVLDHVERAKAALLAAVPSPRGRVGLPLAEALLGFEEGLLRARTASAGWEGAGRGSCEAALEASLAAAERLRLEAPSLDYETMVYALDDLIAPLGAFAEADRAERRR